MYDFFADSSAIGEKEIIIRGSDLNHMKNVLRLQIGEQICIHEESTGKEYRCEIAGYEKDVAHLHIMWVEEANRELPSKIYLFQGLPKGDKMELIIQKAVELGVYEIIPVATKRAVVKLDAKKAEAKQKRWQSIAESAAKQSRRNIIPHIHEVVKFGQAVDYAKNLDITLIPYELAEDMEKTKQIFETIQPGQSPSRCHPHKRGKRGPEPARYCPHQTDPAGCPGRSWRRRIQRFRPCPAPRLGRHSISGWRSAGTHSPARWGYSRGKSLSCPAPQRLSAWRRSRFWPAAALRRQCPGG